MIADMELKLLDGSAPAVKMDHKAKQEFNKHRKQQLQLKKQRKFESQKIQQRQREEEDMLFKDPTESKHNLKDIVKKLQ